MKQLMVLQNGYHDHRLLRYPFLRLRQSNFDVNIIVDHLILVKEKHTFHFDSSLLNLKVCSFIFIRLKVPT